VTGPEGVLIYGAGGYKFVVLDVARSLARTERVWRYSDPAVLGSRRLVGAESLACGGSALPQAGPARPPTPIPRRERRRRTQMVVRSLGKTERISALS